MSTSPSQPVHKPRGQRQLLLIAALFFVPLAVAFWLYYGPVAWRPAGGTNKGELINPAVPLPEVALQRPDGTVLQADWLRGKWTIAYLGAGDCDEQCRKALYLSRQSRIALNKDMERVQRAFIATGPCCDQRFIATEHPDLIVALLDDEPDARTLLAAIPALGGVPPAQARRLYLIDPLGNLVLSYPAAAPDKALLSDLKKLLRLSHIG